jgi:proton-coupled amino acid transporter
VFLSLFPRTVGFAALLPNLMIFMSLIGAVFLSTLGLLFPSVVYMVTHWETLRLAGKIGMILGNIVVLSFGMMALITGTYYSTVDILKFYHAI